MAQDAPTNIKAPKLVSTTAHLKDPSNRDDSSSDQAQQALLSQNASKYSKPAEIVAPVDRQRVLDDEIAESRDPADKASLQNPPALVVQSDRGPSSPASGSPAHVLQPKDLAPNLTVARTLDQQHQGEKVPEKAPAIQETLRATDTPLAASPVVAPVIQKLQLSVSPQTTDTVSTKLLPPAAVSPVQTEAVIAGVGPPHKPASFFDLSAVDVDGKMVNLTRYAGKVVIVVNVASACGFTDENYRGLMTSYEKYNKYGLEILGFPCNQFGGQEQGTESEIKAFCSAKYHVTFPMFSKVDVNGPNTHPVYEFLKRELPVSEHGGGGTAPGADLVWNFNKIFVNRRGVPVRYLNQVFDVSDLEEIVYGLLHETA